MLVCALHSAGLSYTNFSYSDLKITGTDVSVTIKNTGPVHGAEVAQLYLGFPPSAGEPPQVLRGFQKLHLAPGAEATATFVDPTPESILGAPSVDLAQDWAREHSLAKTVGLAKSMISWRTCPSHGF